MWNRQVSNWSWLHAFSLVASAVALVFAFGVQPLMAAMRA